MSNNTTNNNSNTNSNNPPGLEALAALYKSIGAPSNPDTRHPTAAAQALASLASQPTSMQAPAPAAAGPSSSPFGLQSLYAQQVQQLTAAQAQQQHQHAQNQALLKSLPTELLQAYLASTAPQSIPPSLLNNAPQPPQQLQQQQQLHAQAQAIAAQLLASAQASSEVHRPLPSVPSNVSSMLQNDLMETLARAGSANGLGKATSSSDAAGLLNQIQGEAAMGMAHESLFSF